MLTCMQKQKSIKMERFGTSITSGDAYENRPVDER